MNVELNTPSFIEEWKKTLKASKEDIINAIINQTEIKIVLEHSTIKDEINYRKNNSYIPPLIQIEGNTIKTKYISPELIRIVLENLSESIETLNVPGEFLNFSDLLKLYPKLTTINVTNNYEISEKNIIDIKNNTKIENIEAINFEGLTTDYNLNALYYNGDFEEIKLLDSSLTIRNPNKKLTAKVNYFNVPDLYENINDVVNYIKEHNIDPNSYNYFNIISKTLNTNYICYSKEDNELEYDGDLTKINEIISIIEQLGIHPKNIYLRLDNKDYDYKQFKGIKYPIIIDYGDEYSNATLEEFIAMRETINYYKELITSSNLSPLEQITYAYDIIKSFDYNEGIYTSDSRSMHKIINTGSIVCVGYSQFLKQVLQELGYKIETFDLNSPDIYGKYPDNYNNHERNIIRIDDDKYNIHMVAAMDSTWDSGTNEINTYKFNDKNTTTFANVNNLISYIHFLIPKNEYMYLFKDKYLPPFFTINPLDLKENFDEIPNIRIPETEKEEGLKTLQKLFDKGEGKIIDYYLNSKRPSFEIFKEVINNVKMAEGYNLKESQDISNNIVLEEEPIKTRL